MNKANIICFMSTPGLVNQLKDLQTFYGQKTRSKLLVENIVPEALVAVYKNPMPKGLTIEQKKAYKRIFKTMSAFDRLGAELMKMQRERECENSKSKTKTKAKKLSKHSKKSR